MAKNASEAWEDCLNDIRGSVSETQYATFFEPIKFDSYDDEHRKLFLKVPNREVVSYLENSFFRILEEVLSSHFGQISLMYRVQSAAERGNTVINVAEDGARTAEVTTIATNLRPDYTFKTFIEGTSNKLARSIGIEVADHPRSTRFNPMFVYGPSGCGKTHLLNAIGNRFCSRDPKKKVLYVGAHDFMRQYTSSVRDNHYSDFILFYQQFDLLIVDDVQFWERSEKTSDTFFYIFEHYILHGGCLVFAADRTPSQLKNMDGRIISRFSQGVLTELEKPNKKLCYDILKAKIKRDGLEIPDDVVDYIASNADGSVRDLAGVVNGLLAQSIKLNKTIDVDLAEVVLSKIRRTMPTELNGEQVMRVVCRHLGVTKEDITGKSQKHEHVLARQIAMYFALNVAKMNVNTVGRTMGGRNHSTVAYGIKKIEKEMKANSDFARQMKEIESDITSFRK